MFTFYHAFFVLDKWIRRSFAKFEKERKKKREKEQGNERGD